MFADRSDAGARLARALPDAPRDALALGIPRGGVIVARALADALDLEMDVIVVRKIGAPGNPELAIGAVGPDGSIVLDERTWSLVGDAPDAYVRAQARREAEEIDRRMRAYRGDRPALSVGGRACVVVDDGLATGSTAIAALGWLRANGASPLILAVPVAPGSALDRIGPAADRVVCLAVPATFRAVGEWYERFDQVLDDEVNSALSRA